MFSRLVTFVVLAWSALYASAAITILAPSADYWWVTGSQNLYSWTCGSNYNQGYTNFTVYVTNTNTALLSGPYTLKAIQWDYDCSVLLDTIDLPVGTGYVMNFADVFNMTHIIASSSDFEVKPTGSAYAPQPSGVQSATVTATATGSAASGAATSTTTSGAGSIVTSQSGMYGIAGTLFALIAAGLML